MRFELRLAHDPERVSSLRQPTVHDPWRVLLSGCMAAWPCGVDATSFGMEGEGPSWLRGPLVTVVPFCPEAHALGAPRTMPDCHGGDGFDVLAGRATVKDPEGRDLTEAMIAGGRAMVDVARAFAVDFAVLTDTSAACGTQVISLGCRFDAPRRYQRGVGVATALLIEAGFPVVSQRDHRTLAALARRLDPTAPIDAAARDHHEHPWVLEHLPD